MHSKHSILSTVSKEEGDTQLHSTFSHNPSFDLLYIFLANEREKKWLNRTDLFFPVCDGNSNGGGGGGVMDDCFVHKMTG